MKNKSPKNKKRKVYESSSHDKLYSIFINISIFLVFNRIITPSFSIGTCKKITCKSQQNAQGLKHNKEVGYKVHLAWNTRTVFVSQAGSGADFFAVAACVVL